MEIPGQFSTEIDSKWSKRPVPASLWIIVEIIAAVSKGMVIKNAISSNRIGPLLYSHQSNPFECWR
jgi:hypothetical protein